MSIALEGLKEDGYRIGDLQAIRYDKTNPLFSEGYLGRIYSLCKASRRRNGDGILSTVFGGNPPSDFDSIVSYLASRTVVILGRWDGVQFVELGFCFSVINCGRADTEKAIFAGFGFFRESWGTEDQKILAMLGLAFLFQEGGLVAIHGTRYQENVLAAKFMEQFGMHKVGELPHYQLKGTKLVPGIVSTLLREDFVEYLENWLVEQYRASLPAEEYEGPPMRIVEVDPVPPAPVDYESQLPLSWL